MTRLERLQTKLKAAKAELRIREKNHNATSRWYTKVTMLIEERFGTIDVELSGLVEDIVQLPPSQRNRLLLDLSGLSREGLLKRLNKRIS